MLAVRRAKQWFYRPKKEFIFHNGDVIIARGCDDGVDLLKKIAKGEARL